MIDFMSSDAPTERQRYMVIQNVRGQGPDQASWKFLKDRVTGDARRQGRPRIGWTCRADCRRAMIAGVPGENASTR